MKNTDYHTNFLGHYLQERYGSKYCFVPFTSNSGTVGVVAGIYKVKLKRTTDGSFERFIAQKYRCDFGLFALSSPEIEPMIRNGSIVKSKIFWIKEEYMYLPDVCDAVFYINKMKPTKY